MEYQKIVKLLDDTTNQPSKFRTRNWVEINDEQKESMITDSKIRFKIPNDEIKFMWLQWCMHTC